MFLFHYHCVIFMSFQNSPVGLPGGSKANITGVSAPSSGVLGARGPAMSVFTHPGQQALTKISSLPLVANSLA